MEITVDETFSNITSTKGYDTDNDDNNNDDDDNDDESKQKDQIPGVSTSPSNITDMLVNNRLTQFGSYEVPPQLAPSTKDSPGGGLLMNLNPSAINAVVPFVEGSVLGNQGKKLEQLAYIKIIRTAYLKLSRVQHPDGHKNADDNKTANANFLIIKEAYNVLLGPVKCQQYNDQNNVSYSFPFLSDGAATANEKNQIQNHSKGNRKIIFLPAYTGQTNTSRHIYGAAL